MIIQYESSEYAKYDHQWPTASEEIKKVINWFVSGDSYLAVSLKDNQQFIGLISLTQQEDLHEYGFGYIFNSNYHHKGYAFEACKAVLDYAFNHLKAHKVTAGTAAVNVSSCKLLERLSFTIVGEKTSSFRKSIDGKPIEFVGLTFSLSRNKSD